ncbi:hypothetical protein OROGR_000607 [Orobanche gracilis]
MKGWVMAMGTRRSSKALHNFTMPGELRWGNQRHLRCTKVNTDERIAPLRRFTAVDAHTSDRSRIENSVQHRRDGRDGERRRDRVPSFEFMHGSHKSGVTPTPALGGGWEFSDGDEEISAVRERVMFDLQAAADRIRDAIFKDGLEKGEVPGYPTPAVPSAEGEIHMPWNLRTRRDAGKTQVSRLVCSLNADAATDARDALKINSGLCQASAEVSAAAADKSIKLRSSGGCYRAAIGKKRERPKFALALSKTEIENDFLGMVGRRPARRPKKRARIIQRQLDALFPGLCLKEATHDMYKVSEAAP